MKYRPFASPVNFFYGYYNPNLSFLKEQFDMGFFKQTTVTFFITLSIYSLSEFLRKTFESSLD